MKKILFTFLLLSTITVNAATISTLFATNNSHTGNMFDLTNISASAVELTGIFSGNFQAGTAGNVQMWYRNGTYIGNEANASSWSLLGTSSFTSAGLNIATSFDVGNSLVVNSGEVIGLYMLSDVYNSVLYTNGSNTFSDSIIQLDLGGGTDDIAFSGNVFSPRTWNGTIDYNTNASAVPAPAVIWLLGSGLIGLVGMRKKSAKLSSK